MDNSIADSSSGMRSSYCRKPRTPRSLMGSTWRSTRSPRSLTRETTRASAHPFGQQLLPEPHALWGRPRFWIGLIGPHTMTCWHPIKQLAMETSLPGAKLLLGYVCQGCWIEGLANILGPASVSIRSIMGQECLIYIQWSLWIQDSSRKEPRTLEASSPGASFGGKRLAPSHQPGLTMGWPCPITSSQEASASLDRGPLGMVPATCSVQGALPSWQATTIQVKTSTQQDSLQKMQSKGWAGPADRHC